METRNTTSATQEWRRFRRIATYGFAAIIVLFGVSIGLTIYLRGLQLGPWPFYPAFGFSWIWLIFAFFLGFWVLRWIFWPWRPYGYRYSTSDDSLSILRARYARGEITKEQFDQMSKDLRDPRRSLEE